MTYQQTVLNDKPAGFWMITAASGTSETDLSGNSKTATITEATDLIDRGYRPLVTGTSTDRAYRFYSGNHKLTYPSLEIWDKGRTHIPFSVEFTVQPITSRRRVTLFGPQEASNADVPDNGIYLENGRLYFSVSNGSAASVPTVKSVASTWLSTGTTYHVVAVYDVANIYLYVNGVLAAQEAVNPAISWSHTVANFITTAYSITSDTTSSSFLFDAVSVYRSALSPETINNHYIFSTPNISDIEIANSLGGKIIKLNDGDRTKAFEYSAKERGWSNNLNIITDLVQNDDGSIGLKKIAPMKLYNTSYNYNNLLTSQQANGDGGWIMQGAYGTLSSTTNQPRTGTNSIEFTTTSGSCSQSPGNYGIISLPKSGGKTFTWSVWMRAEQASRFGQATIYTYPGEFVGGGHNSTISSGSVALTSGAWVQVTATGTFPETCNTVLIATSVSGMLAGEKVWMDDADFHEGTSKTYRAPDTGPTFVASADISTRPRNILTWGGATAEESYTGMVVSNTNQSLARVSTDFYSGSNSWQVTSTGAGASVLSITHSQFPVEPGRTYTLTCKVKPVTTARNVQQYVNWYDSANTLLGSSTPTGNTTTLNAWTTVRKTIIAPPKAVKGDLYTQTTTNMVTGEVFYFDEIGLIEGDTTQWVAPTYNNSPYELSTKEFKYASLEKSGEHFGADQGAFGLFALFTTAQNDDIDEQVLASLASSDQTYVIEAVKKSDKNLYIRYRYRNQSGVITTTETSWGAISSLLGGLPYIYVEWGGGILSLYVNSTTSPAQIAFDSQIPAPRFDKDSTFNLGAGYDGARPWTNYFRTLKLYDKVQPASEFNINKTKNGRFMAKFEGNLNVSQYGSIVVGAPTGTDEVSAVDQTRITWTPTSNNVAVSSSINNSGNLMTYNQATGADLSTTGWQGDGATIARYTADKYAGVASLEATSTSTVRVGIQTNTGSWTVAPGQVYTITCAVKSATTTLSGSAKFTVFDSVGGYLTDVGVAINTTGGGWNVFTGQVTIPANGYSVTFNPYLMTPIVGTKVYFDQMGFWLGTDTTWTEPYQTNSYGSEIVPDQFPYILPGKYYSKAILSTNDSYYAPTRLTDIKLEAFEDNAQFAENGWDQLVGAARDRVYDDGNSEIRQALYNGAYVNSKFNNFYIYPVNDTGIVSIPDGGTSASTGGPAALARTVEFWVYPETQGYHFWHDGPTEYSMRYYDSGGFTTTGFTTLYVDGTSTANGVTSTTWYNRWHHIVLTNASAQINLNTDIPAGVNILTANQASVETNTTGLVAVTACSIARTTAVSYEGAAALEGTSNAAAAARFGTTGANGERIVVTPGKTYTAQMMMRAPVITTTIQLVIMWYDAANAFVSSSVSSAVALSTTWTKHTVTGVAPPGAVSCYIRNQWTAAAAGEVVQVDAIGFWEGASNKWTLPGEPEAINLLTPNQASVETDTTGLLTFGNCTIARTTTVARHGTASLALTATANADMAAGINTLVTGIVPGQTYTMQAYSRAATTPRGSWVEIGWHDAAGTQLTVHYGSSTTNTTGSWTRHSLTMTAPAAASQCRVYIKNLSVVIGEVHYWDSFGFWVGSATTWQMPDARAWFGTPVPALNQTTARYQNISYYPQTFDAGMVTANYKAYLGDITGGSVTDSGLSIFRNTSDAANLLTSNQASAEGGNTTGMENVTNCTSSSIVSGNSQHGSRIFAITAVANGTVTFGAGLESTMSTCVPVTAGKTYTAFARLYAVPSGRTAQVYIRWYNSGGTPLANDFSANTAIASNVWETRSVTITAPATAAYASMRVSFPSSPLAAENFYADCLGIWEGAGVEWAPPVITSPNPKTFNDLWTVETIKNT